MAIYRVKRFSFISRGLRFIKDLKQLDPLPMTIEEYSIFLFHFEEAKKIFKGFRPRIKESETLRKRVNDFYKNPDASDIISRIGMGIVFGNTFDLYRGTHLEFVPEYGKDKNYTKALKISFDKINHLPKRYLIDSAGQGMTGIVFDYPGGKIEKISYNGFTKSELKFYGYLEKNPIPEFPKVYSLEKDQLIVEKLETSSPKLDKWGNYIREYREQDGLHREINLNKVLRDLGENHEFYIWAKNVYEGLYKILGVRTFGDISPKNIGERKSTGEIVFFDPIGGSLLMD